MDNLEKQKLDWALRISRQENNFLLPGDLINRQYEIAFFIGEDWHKVYARNELPGEQEIKEIIEHIKGIIQKAVERGEILIPASKYGGKIYWDEKENHFRYLEDIDANWETRATHVLKDLILKYGHLLKKCVAPAIRGKEGELCGRLFLASRPDRKYCSSQCLSRATTRRARMRQ